MSACKTRIELNLFRFPSFVLAFLESRPTHILSMKYQSSHETVPYSRLRMAVLRSTMDLSLCWATSTYAGGGDSFLCLLNSVPRCVHDEPLYHPGSETMIRGHALRCSFSLCLSLSLCVIQVSRMIHSLGVCIHDPLNTSAYLDHRYAHRWMSSSRVASIGS